MDRVKSLFKFAKCIIGIKDGVELRIKPLKTTIARASITRGVITIDPAVKNISENLLLYLFIHELAHIKTKNQYHTPSFWKEIEKLYPVDKIEELENMLIENYWGLKNNAKEC